MRILVTFAVDWECKPWLRLGKFQAVPGNSHAFRTHVAASDVNILLTGIGPANALRSIRNLMDTVPDCCITSGLAGGLKHHHRPGEILAARTARSEAASEAYDSDDTLFSAALDSGAKPVDRLISTRKVIRTAQEKFRLSASADAVDMESFAIMKEMSGLGVPCVAVRSVSDSAEMDVPCDFDRALDDSGHIKIAHVLGQIVTDPRQLWPLARLGVRSSRAATSLARFLEAYIACLAGQKEPKEKMDLSVQRIS
jgi:adenosylhomocysteine nucleosidase